MPTTAFTDLVGCQVPIQQAGMGGVATPELPAGQVVRELAEGAERLLRAASS